MNQPETPSSLRDHSRQESFLLGVFAIIAASIVYGLYLYFGRRLQQLPPFTLRVAELCILGLFVFGLFRIWLATLSRQSRERVASLTPYTVKISREGGVYLVMMVVMLVGALLGRSNLLLLVFSLMAGPFVLNGWISFTMLRSVRLSRLTPRRVMAGELFSIEMRLHNRWKWLTAWMMEARDEIDGPSGRLLARCLFACVRGGEVQTAAYQLTLPRRGLHRLGPCSAASQYPLGLIVRTRTFSDFAEVLVYPRIGQINPRWLRMNRMAEELVMQPNTRPGLFDDEFHHMREYRPGDNPRAIHWRSSARRNTLILREYHQNRAEDLALVLDLHLDPRQSKRSLERAELLLSLAASIAAEQVRVCRDSTLLVALAGANSWTANTVASAIGLEDVLDRLALAAAGTATDIGDLFDTTVGLASSTSRVVLLSTRDEVDLQAALETSSHTQGMGGRLTLAHVDSARASDWISYAEVPR